MKSCRVRSHLWAAPESVTQWSSKRGVADAVPVCRRPDRPIKILGDAVCVATVELPMDDLGSTIDTFGVPSSMVRTYMKTPCVDTVWPMLRSYALRSHAAILGKKHEYSAIEEACLGAKSDRKMVGKMITVSEYAVDPRRHSTAIFQLERQGRRNILKADLYITRSAKCAKSQHILKMSDSCPLISPDIDATVFPSILSDRECFEHQYTSLGHMLHMEEHGLTHRLWTASFNEELVCLMNDRLGSTHLLKRPFKEEELPDRVCRGGLLCNDRGTGKTMIACALIASRGASEEWLKETKGDTIDNTVRIIQTIDSDFESDDEQETEERKPAYGYLERTEGMGALETEIQRRNAEACPRVAATLVVLPSHNLISQWKEEAEALGLNVLVRHGVKKIESIEELSSCDVVITTALTLAKDFTSTIFANVRFWRIVVDEIHKILASAKISHQAAAIMKIRANHRWGITATPDLRPWSIRNYLRFLYGIPDMASAALNHIHHYLLFPSQYRGINADRQVFFPAIAIQEPASIVRPAVHHHIISAVAHPDWMRKYKDVFEKCKACLPHLTGLGEQRLINQLLMAIGGAKDMPMPDVSEFLAKMKDLVDSDIQVPPDVVDCSICLQELAHPVMTQCNHFFCEGCLARWRDLHPRPRCPICRGGISPGSIKKCVVIEEPDASAINTLAACPAKIEAVVSALLNVISEDPHARFLVFSRFPGVRKAIKQAIEDVLKYTENVKRFQSDTSYVALILSPNSCAVGLNLTQANHVFLVEPAFKTSTEKQAFARADRIGQTREVHVHRFQVVGTIEETIQRKRKQKLGDSSIASYAFQA